MKTKVHELAAVKSNTENDIFKKSLYIYCTLNVQKGVYTLLSHGVKAKQDARPESTGLNSFSSLNVPINAYRTSGASPRVDCQFLGSKDHVPLSPYRAKSLGRKKPLL